MRVLLIVDPQNDFMPGGPLGVDEGDQIIERINELMRSGNYDLIIVTKDAHSKNHRSFASSHPGQNPFDRIVDEGQVEVLWPDHCIFGSEGAKLHPGLDLSRVKYTVEKDSPHHVYGGFKDTKGRTASTLESILLLELESRGESPSDCEIDFCGLALDYCVGTTAKQAVEVGFRANIVLDATRAIRQNMRELLTVLREFRNEGVELITSRERINERSRREVQLQP
jgi:nicotinamidase/pyrazinamidase